MKEGRSVLPEISVIIVNWNGKELLDDCLRALQEQTFQDFEVVVVDNCSTDGSVEWLADNHPEARVLRLERNMGFSAGNNAGLSLARGKYIALLNNDTKAEPEWLAALHRAIRSDPQIAACDSKILYYDRPDIIWSSGACYTVAGSVRARWHGEPDSPEKHGISETFIAVACAAIYRREAIDRIGLFDQDFFNGYEDVDWSFRARLCGYRIVNQPLARVLHKVSFSQGHNSTSFVYNGQRNVSAVFLKNMPGPLLFKYWPFHLAYMIGSGAYFARIGRTRAFLRAKRDFLLQLPAIWRKRIMVQRLNHMAPEKLEAMMERNWLKVKMEKYREGDPSKP